jgi:hypothetical protein
MVDSEYRPTFEGTQQIFPELPGGADDDYEVAVCAPDAKILPNRRAARRSWRCRESAENRSKSS